MGLPLLELLAFLRTRGVVRSNERRAAPRRRHRLADRPFALAAAARPLAAPLRHRRLLHPDRARRRRTSRPGLRALPALGFRGVNVTIPHKEAALALATEASPRAAGDRRRQHADLRPGRRDPRRQYRRLRLHRQSAPAGARLARRGRARRWCSAPAAAPARSSRRCSPKARRRCASPTAPAPAPRRCARISARGSWSLDWAEAAGRRGRRRHHRQHHVARHGRQRRPAARPGAACPPRPLVTDLVYGGEPTPFVAAARRRGLTAVDGLGMLLHQAVPGFERWFGVPPEVDAALRAAVLAA